MEDLAKNGEIPFVKGPLIPEAKKIGFMTKGGIRTDPLREVDDNFLKRLLAIDTVKGPKVVKGSYMLPEPVAQVIQNYLTPGWAGIPAYDSLRAVSNNMNALQLSMSPFHVMTTAINATSTQASIGLKQFVTPGQRHLALANLLSSPKAIWNEGLLGSEMMKAWYGRGAPGAQVLRMVDALEKGGGAMHMDRAYEGKAMLKVWNEYKDSAFGDWQKALARGESKFGAMREVAKTEGKLGAIASGPFAAAQWTSKIILEDLVPRVKAGAFHQMMAYEMLKEAHSRGGWEHLDEDVQRKIAAHAWDSVENRFGELKYDNTFMRRTYKDAMMLATRALGWNLGTWREAFGAAFDTGAMFRGKDGRALQDVFTHRMAYVMSNVMITAVGSATLQYLLSGKMPSGYKDYFYPQSGETVPRSKGDKKAPIEPIRMEFPSYTAREWLPMIIAYYQEGGALGLQKHVWDVLKNKLGPLPTTAAEWFSQTDYKGAPIIDPNHPVGKKWIDFLKWGLEQFSPISMKAAEQIFYGGKSKKYAYRDAALNTVGIMPASRSIDDPEINHRTVRTRIGAKRMARVKSGIQ